jgi:hypothetical protein
MTSQGSLEKKASAPEDIRRFFADRGKTVLTFSGFSGAGYEDPSRMLEIAAKILDGVDPKTTIINVGATTDGIGAVYQLAKDRGFQTTGIVSTEAIGYEADISPAADHVFFVQDAAWGGFLDDSEQLSPTSAAIVAVSDGFVAIGGGKVARDELLEAQRIGKEVSFHPADMNHAKAREKAEEKGLPAPTDFRGAAAALFA